MPQIDMLIPVFSSVLRASWQVSFLIAAILLVQYFFQRFLTPRWRYALWFLVIARLILPSLPESYFSVFNLLPAHRGQLSALQESLAGNPLESAANRARSAVNPTEPLSSSLIDKALPAFPITQTPSPGPLQERHLTDMMLVVWLMGTFLLLAFLLGQVVSARYCCRNLPPITDQSVLQLFEHCRSQMEVSQQIRLVEAPRMNSPALFGLMHLVLLLPSGMADGIGTANLRHVFLHELAHVKRRDIWVNWIATLLRTLHWFNPLVWYAFRRMRTDQELACDALALSYTQEGESIEYGATIVTLLERSVLPQRLPGTAGILEDKNRMRRRIEMIATFKKPGPAWTVLTVVLVAALGLGMLTEGRTRGTDTVDAATVVGIGTNVDFPMDQSVGNVMVRDKGSVNREDWIFYSDAKGEVRLPNDSEIQILFSRYYQGNLDFLKSFPTDSLNSLNFDRCPLDDANIKVLARFTTLKELVISRTTITDIGLSNLAGLESLRTLGLARAKITSKGIESIANLSNLTNLDLYKVALGEEGVNSVRSFINLTSLNLEGTGITAAGLAVLKDLKYLEDLTLAGNSLSGGGLAVLSQLPHLKRLVLKEAQINDSDIQLFKRLASLQELDLSATGITDSGIAAISELTALRTLILEDTPITDAGLSSLSGLTNLASINLNNTKITDAGLVSFVTIVSLNDLETFGTGVTEQGLDQLCHILPKIRCSNPEAPKVGVIFSHVSANNPRFMASPNGYSSAEGLARVFRKNHLNVYALIDPGSENYTDLLEVLARVGLVDRMIPVTDVESLQKLDVIASGHDPNQLEEAIRAIGSAVSRGVGFFNLSGFAQHSPGYTQDVQRLLGIKNGAYNYRSGQFTCPVIATHPILGLIEPGDAFWIWDENGFEGAVDGTPLLGPPSGFNPSYCPLYVRQCGEGRVVSCQWWSPNPRPTPPYTPSEFLVRCVNWAAKRPVDSKW